MTIIVHASIALKWVLDEPGSDAAEVLLEKDVAAPSLWLLDAEIALWRGTVRGELTAAEAAERLTELAKAPVASVLREQDFRRRCAWPSRSITRSATVSTCRSRSAWGPVSFRLTPGSARRWLATELKGITSRSYRRHSVARARVCRKY